MTSFLTHFFWRIFNIELPNQIFAGILPKIWETKIFFSNDELHIILKRRTLEIEEFFSIIGEIVLSINLEV